MLIRSIPSATYYSKQFLAIDKQFSISANYFEEWLSKYINVLHFHSKILFHVLNNKNSAHLQEANILCGLLGHKRKSWRGEEKQQALPYFLKFEKEFITKSNCSVWYPLVIANFLCLVGASFLIFENLSKAFTIWQNSERKPSSWKFKMVRLSKVI